jgi:hypothetical protein
MKDLGTITFTTDTMGDVVDLVNVITAWANSEVISANSTVGITGSALSPVTGHVHGNVSATALHTSTLAGGNNSVVGALTITSSTTVGNTLVANTTTARGLLTANAGLIVNGIANVSANTAVGGSLAVTGNTSLTGNLFGSSGTLKVSSNTTVTGQFLVNGKITANGAGEVIQLNAVPTQDARMSLAQNGVVAATFGIASTGTSTKIDAQTGTTTGFAYAGSDRVIVGSTGVAITGNTAVTGTFSATGNTSVSVVTLTSNATSNTFTVANSVVNLANQVYVAGNTNVGIGTLNPSKKLHVIGDAQLTGNTNQTGHVNITQTLTVGGLATITGNVSSSGNVSANYATFTGTVSGAQGSFSANVTVAATGTLIALGNSSLQNTSVKSLTASGASAFNAPLTVSSTLGAGNTTVTGFANVTGDIRGATLTIDTTASTGNLTCGTITAQNTSITNLNISGNTTVLGTLQVTNVSTTSNVAATNLNASANVASNTVNANTVSLNTISELKSFSNGSLGTIGSKKFYEFPMGTYRSGEILVEFWDGSSQYQSSSLIVVNDGSNAYLTMFGTVSAPPSANSSPLLAEITATINTTSSSVELYANTHVANVRAKGAAKLIKV